MFIVGYLISQSLYTFVVCIIMLSTRFTLVDPEFGVFTTYYNIFKELYIAKFIWFSALAYFIILAKSVHVQWSNSCPPKLANTWAIFRNEIVPSDTLSICRKFFFFILWTDSCYTFVAISLELYQFHRNYF